MKRLIFLIVAATFLSVLVASEAKAGCGWDKNNNEISPIAIADATGVLVTTTPTGGTIQISGFWPGAELCRNLLFASTSNKCRNGIAKVDTLRDPKYCKRGVNSFRKCFHITCDPKAR